MTDPQDAPLLSSPEEGSGQQVELFEPAPDTMPPVNAPELAAQLAIGEGAISDQPFMERLSRTTQDISTHGADALVSDAAVKERHAMLDAARQQAIEFSKQGAGVSLESAARLIKGAEEQLSKKPSRTEGHEAAAKRALESAGIQYAINRYKSFEEFDKVVKKEGDLLTLRNVVAHEVGKSSNAANFWDWVQKIGGDIVAAPVKRYKKAQAISAITGVDRTYDLEQAALDFRDLYRSAAPSERLLMVERLREHAVGLFGSNPADSQELLDVVANITREGSNQSAFLDTLTVADWAAAAKGIAYLVKAGSPLKVLNNVAGSEAAAKVAASDLLNASRMGGLNNEELTARFLAAGTNPIDIDPATFSGMSAAGQSELRKAWEELRTTLANSLRSSGLTPDEIKDGLAKIRESYSPETNRAIHNVVFGEGGESGQKMVVYWQGPEGRAFASKEAAEAWAKAEGKLTYEVVPKNSASVIEAANIRAQRAWHGSGDLFERFAEPDFSGQIGWGVSTTVVSKVANRFAQVRGAGSIQGPVKYTVDIPDNNKFLNWFAPLREQPEVVQKALAKLLPKEALSPDTSGAALYDAVAKALGGSYKSASKALRKEGVVGNWSPARGGEGTAGQADFPEHLLFDPKDVKVLKSEKLPRDERFAKVEEEPIVIDGETFFSKELADLDNLSIDELLELVEKKFAEPSPWAKATADAAANRLRGKSAINRGERLFTKGRLEVSDGISGKMQKVLSSWIKMLKMEGENILIITHDEMAALVNNAVYKSDPMLQGAMSRALRDLHRQADRVNGMYTTLTGRAFGTKNNTHVIVLNKKKQTTWREQMATLAHEMGHAFDITFLKNLHPARLAELKQSFASFMQANFNNSSSVGQLEGKFRLLVEDDAAEQIVQLRGYPLGAMSLEDLKWYSAFEEYFAENFAKFMLTDAKPVSALEQVFAEYARKLKEFFRNVANELGFEVAPDEAIARMLRDHINNPSFGRAQGADLLRGKNTPLVGDALAQVPRNKPHIKLKLPSSPTEEWLVRETRTDPLSFDNIGKFSDEDIRSMPWIAIDPKHSASEWAVEERVIGVHQEAKTRKDLVNFITPFFDRLSGAGKERVRNVLREGDSFSNMGDVGKEFAYQELKARGLSDVEAQAYFAARQVRMMTYHMRNAEMVRVLRAEGFREVELLADASKHAGRTLDRAGANSALGRTAYDTVEGAQMLVGADNLDAAYAAGKQVVELKQPVKMDGKLYYTLVVDQSTAKARDIHTALHYRPGEFSRIYTDQYFITTKRQTVVDGAPREVVETVRTATSQQEAKAFVEANKKAIALLEQAKNGDVPRNLDAELEKLIGQYDDVAEYKARFNNGEMDDIIGMDFHYTRNKEEYLNASVSEAVANGRLFTSKRSEKLFSVDRTRRNTLDVFESLEAEITNISRVTNINAWRESMIRRWMNSFGDMLPTRTGNDVADFFTAAGGSFTRGTREAKFAERTHRYIMRQLGIKTQEEKYYESISRTLSEQVLALDNVSVPTSLKDVRRLKEGEAIESVGAKIRSMSWLGFIRNINFNLNLGMFNPAQLIVQANGATTAMVLSPLHGAKAANTFPLLRMALMSDNPDVWRRLANIEKWKNLGLSNAEEFIDLVKAIRKTGIIDNMQSTALWNLEDGALNVFSGYPRRAMGSHTFFFNRGEEFSRIVSFDVARREWMAKHPGQAWNTDAALKEMVVRMDDLTQNMTKANLARFQEGALSIPLQFAQYNIKLAANVVSALLGKGTGRGFTKGEALRLMIGHIVLYGAAGNGMMGLAEDFIGTEAKDSMTPEMKNLLGQGAAAWALDAVSQALTGEGAKVALGSRLGSFDYYQRIAEAVYKDPKNVFEALLGPTVSSAKRLGTIGEVVGLWRKDPDLTGRDILEGLGKMSTEQVAMLRNAAKAYLYLQHQGKMLDRKGTPIATLSNSEMLWQALGFMPTASVDVHQLISSKKDHSQAISDIADSILRVQRDIMTALVAGDEERAAEQRKLLVALWPTNAGDFMEVQRRIKDKLFPYDTTLQKLLGEYMMKGQTYNKPLVVTEQPRKHDDEDQ